METGPIPFEGDHQSVPVDVWAVMLEPVHASNYVVAKVAHDGSSQADLDVAHLDRKPKSFVGYRYATGVS